MYRAALSRAAPSRGRPRRLGRSVTTPPGAHKVLNRDYEFVEALPEELTCSICTKVLCQPHLVNCCEQQFCKDCLDEWSRSYKTCPHCRSTDFSTILLKQKSRKVGEVKVYCLNKRHGCKAELKISEYENHLRQLNPLSASTAEVCQYIEVNCPYQCTAKIFLGEVKKHLLKECPRRSVACAYCNAQGEHQHILGSHVEECPSYPLTCPLQCGARLIRKDLESHHSTCPLECVLCPFSGSGCKTKIHRKDLEKHVETNTTQHVIMLAESHTALQAEHAALQSKVQAIASVIKSPQTGSASSKISQEIYAILTDSAILSQEHPLTLQLTLSEKPGQQDFLLSPNGYKFRLKWKKDIQKVATFQNPLKYTFMLQHVREDLMPTMNGETFNINIELCSKTGTFSIIKGEVKDGLVQLTARQTPKEITLEYRRGTRNTEGGTRRQGWGHAYGSDNDLVLLSSDDD